MLKTQITQNQEDEVVLLPGNLFIKYKDNRYIVKYKMNKVLVNHIKDTVQTGSASKAEKRLLKALCIPKLSLRNKAAVYYRVVYNRQVECLHCLWFPKLARDIPDYVKNTMRSVDKFYEDSVRVIPDYRDLQAQLQDETLDKEERDLIRQKQRSYMVFMAIYNWKTRQVEHYHYGIYDWMIKEGGFTNIDERKSEIEKAIQEYMIRFEKFRT